MIGFRILVRGVKEAKEEFEEIRDFPKNFAKKAWSLTNLRKLGEATKDAQQKKFHSMGFGKWARLKSSTIETKKYLAEGGKISSDNIYRPLMRFGDFAKSFRYHLVPREYQWWFMFGAEGTLPSREGRNAISAQELLTMHAEGAGKRKKRMPLLTAEEFSNFAFRPWILETARKSYPSSKTRGMRGLVREYQNALNQAVEEGLNKLRQKRKPDDNRT